MGKRRKIIIVGAGIGGLSAAALLSRTFDVVIYEKAHAPGGKIRQIQAGDHTVDAGPTVFTMRWVFEDIFRRAGSSLAKEVSLTKLDILARHAWRDGSMLDLHADPHRSAQAIGDFASARDAENFLAYTKRARIIFETLKETFIKAQAPSLSRLILSQNPLSHLSHNPFATLWRELSRQFEDPRLRQLFARYSTYCGSSPFLSPSTLMLISHVEQEGVWSLKGGMQSIASALMQIAQRNGATFHFNANVKTIISDNKKVSGIELETSERIFADSVVFNGDPSALGAGFLGDTIAHSMPSKAITRSQSAMTWTALTKTRGFPLHMHNVFFSDDYRSEFDDVFTDNRVPNTPTTYVFAPAYEAGQERQPLFCLINAPANGDQKTYSESELETCRKNTFDHLEQCGLTLEAQPPHIQATAPSDFAAMFPGTGGALYGMASHGWRASFQRPSTKTKLAGFYLTGGGIHPGPGVPMAALSGKAAANAIFKDFGLTSKSMTGDMRGGTSTPLAMMAYTE